MNRRSTAAARVLVGVVVLCLTACSDDDDHSDGDRRRPDGPASNGVMEVSAGRAARLADRATRALDDVVYAGRISVPVPGGSLSGRGRVSIAGPRTCELRIRVDDGGGLLTTRVAEGHLYTRATAEVWGDVLDVPTAQVTHLDGKWLVANESSGPDTDCYRHTFGTAASVEHCFEGRESGEVRGNPARIVQCAASGFGTHKLYISTIEQPVVLRRIGIDDEAPFDVTLVARNTGVTVAPPPERDVVNSPTRTA